MVRRELKLIATESKFWDGRVCELHVTEAKEKTLEIRALVSAVNSSAAFDLRCEVREKLVTFIQQNYPGSLPKVRSEMEGNPQTGNLPAIG